MKGAAPGWGARSPWRGFSPFKGQKPDYTLTKPPLSQRQRRHF